jgi:hypothetical protein
MILLLFFTTLAVLYYVVPVPEPEALSKESQGLETDRQRSGASPPEAIATPGLIALGRALDQHGRGQTPQTAPELQYARKSQ